MKNKIIIKVKSILLDINYLFIIPVVYKFKKKYPMRVKYSFFDFFNLEPCHKIRRELDIFSYAFYNLIYNNIINLELYKQQMKILVTNNRYLAFENLETYFVNNIYKLKYSIELFKILKLIFNDSLINFVNILYLYNSNTKLIRYILENKIYYINTEYEYETNEQLINCIIYLHKNYKYLIKLDIVVIMRYILNHSCYNMTNNINYILTNNLYNKETNIQLELIQKVFNKLIN